MLDRCRGEFLADAGEQRVPLGAVAAGHAQLDQLVRLQRDIDLVQNRGSEAVLADRDDGVQVVGGRAELATPRGGE